MAISLDKIEGIKRKKYVIIRTLIKIFKVKEKSDKPISGQRFNKLSNRKKSKHPLIDKYIEYIKDKVLSEEVKKKDKERLKKAMQIK